MIRVAILGGTGYTAFELMKLLLRHPEAKITALTSRTENKHVSAVHPALRDRLDLHLEDLAPAEIAARADCVFSCLPHCASAKIATQLLDAGAKVIDFSADYRLDDVETFEHWYGEEHSDAGRLGKVAYGLPELFRKQIVGANLIANPGCYPTSAILPLVPLIKAGLVEPHDIIVDSKSGVSGAGRTPKLGTLFPECNESVSAYNVGKHRHTPEIEQIVGRGTGKKIDIVFTPHLMPMDRGILSTTYSKPTAHTTEDQLYATLREFYAREPFVRVTEALPATKDTVNSNFCDIAVRLVRGRVITISALDNLIKGASGAAVQNFNVLYGFPEMTALL